MDAWLQGQADCSNGASAAEVRDPGEDRGLACIASAGPLSIGCEASHPRAASRPGSNEIAQQSLSQEWGTDVSAQWPSAVPAQFAASRTGQSHD